MIDKDLLTIGELTKKMGVTVRTLQYYDKKELLKPSFYIVPLVFFGFMGGIFTSINPSAYQTLLPLVCIIIVAVLISVWQIRRVGTE